MINLLAGDKIFSFGFINEIMRKNINQKCVYLTPN